MTEGPAGSSCVVVGVDGSPGSRRALEWALNKRDRLGRIKPVITFHAGPFSDGFGTITGVKPEGQPYRDEAFAAMSEVLEAIDPHLREQAEVIQHWPGPGLVEASRDANLLVVGNRGRTALAETLLGSVGSYCVKHSQVPVAVIPDNVPTTEPLSTLVVGVDGSTNAEAALRWAIEHVEPEGKIVALGVYPPADLHGAESTDQHEIVMRRQVEDSAAKSLRRTGLRRDVEIRITPGDPRTELPMAAQQADLVVVGSRGHRAVAHLLLGSVATALTHHPELATVVVPDR
ncbi:MAG: universal stress protein [Acidimicrobiales bacterium]